VSHVYGHILLAMYDQSWALYVLDEVDVTIAFGQEVAEKFSNVVTSNLSKRFEWRHKDQSAHHWSFLSDETSWT
jgi:hypothetical protein